MAIPKFLIFRGFGIKTDSSGQTYHYVSLLAMFRERGTKHLLEIKTTSNHEQAIAYRLGSRPFLASQLWLQMVLDCWKQSNILPNEDGHLQNSSELILALRETAAGYHYELTQSIPSSPVPRMFTPESSPASDDDDVPDVSTLGYRFDIT